MKYILIFLLLASCVIGKTTTYKDKKGRNFKIVSHKDSIVEIIHPDGTKIKVENGVIEKL